MNTCQNTNNSSCPLISERKSIKEKIADSLYSIGIMNYKEKDLILIGYKNEKFEIYDSINLTLLIESSINEKKGDINYIGQLEHNTFTVISGRFIFIYLLYSILDKSSNIENYHIALVQTIKYENERRLYYGLQFNKALLFDKDLYKKNIKSLKKKLIFDGVSRNEFEYNYNNELIISGATGVYILEKKKAKEEDDLNNMDIKEFINYRTINKYMMKEQITNLENYDIIQVNYKYLAGTIDNFLCIYSKNEHQLTTKFEASISRNCDSIMYMLNEDILCLAGMDTISLVSIEKFDIIFIYSLKDDIKITEICILPDYNVLVGIEKFEIGRKEYFYQYKLVSEINEKNKKIEYKLEEVSHKLITEHRSNITMRCLSNNKLVTIIDFQKIQIWE